MKSFNLFPTDIGQKFIKSNIIKLSGWTVSIFGVLFVCIFLSVIIFIGNLYLNTQLDNKGKVLIQRYNSQQTFKDTISKASDAITEKSAVATLSQDNNKIQDIIRQLDIATQNSITTYNIDKTNLIGSIRGNINVASDISTMFLSLKSLPILNGVRILQIQKSATNYTYDISFNINNEKV